jgi:hypothetical protein
MTPDKEHAIAKQAFEKIGGKPKDFLKITINNVYDNHYRVNVYTRVQPTDSVLPTAKLETSLFLTA